MHDVRDFAGRGIEPADNFASDVFLQRGVNLWRLRPPSQKDRQDLNFIAGEAGKSAF